MYKSFADISWKVTEPEYREDPALSYSTLAKYERGGFNGLHNLFDKVESPSLLFGSMVDTLITGSREEFDNLYLIAEFPPLEPANITITKAIFNIYKDNYPRLSMIPDRDIIVITEQYEYQLRWKPETRAKVIKEKCEEYYNLLKIAEGKTVVDTETYNKVLAAVRALRCSESTKDYFDDNNSFDDSIERLYQLKFKATFEDIDYRCMADLIYCDYKNKIIYPCDLKTSSHKEWNFYESFIQWLYPIQARLYWRIIRENMNKDEYFKDFTLAPYKFIVINKETLTPLVWNYEDTEISGDLIYGKNKNIILRDPFTIGKELSHYLKDSPRVPDGISLNKTNSLKEWLNKM